MPDPAPIVDCSGLTGDASARASVARRIAAASCDPGYFYAVGHGIDAGLCRAVIEHARAFFTLPPADKAAVDIRRSPHFRGYSAMRNARDWREQLHFGAEGSPASDHEAWRTLEGPNLWPAALGPSFRVTLLDFMERAAEFGARLVAALAAGLCCSADPFASPPGSMPYRLLKLIAYHPQVAAGETLSGVAPHCDWSILTLLLQDDVGGLEVADRAGAWSALPPLPGALVVNVGELAELVTGGRVCAAPHRVINRSPSRTRMSVPVFINPPLDQAIGPFAARPARSAQDEATHVHRVLQPGSDPRPIHFGASEWQRKGLGRWCWRSTCTGL